MASDENIKIAVRLRPFIECMKQEAEGKVKRIVDLDELSASVLLTNLDNPVETHKFSFDNVLWSFDGYSEQSDGYLTPDNKTVSDEIYCDQKQVYDEIGKELVQNLWNGYNTAIFTFGETRSGKSWTLFGLGVNKGILPQAFTDLFKSIRDKEKALQQNGSSLEVRLSMAEIYNDRIKDLLVSPQSSNTAKMKSVLKIRHHSRKGFYIEGLRSVLVVNHDDIQQRLEDGLFNRAVYLTNCNATCDNTMTFVSTTLVQRIRNHRGDEVTRVATLEAFDLPACEYMGQCDDESLETYISTNPLYLRRNGIHSLAQCVDHLLEASVGKLQDYVEYENHAVTKLLKNALSGNSRTWMVAALSPSNFSYKNSLYVLKLAERVRMLSTRSIVNEEVTSKLVRETKGENERLKKLITLGGGDLEGTEFSARMDRVRHSGSMERDIMKKKIVEDVKAQIRENERELRNIQLSYEERLKPFKAEKNDLSKRLENDKKSKSHIYNLSKDAQVSGKVVHILPLGTVDFGHSQQAANGKSRENNCFIFVCGPGIREHHGSFAFNSKDGKVSIKPGGPDSSIFVNETKILFDTVLSHNDRIILGGGQLWIYQNPKETWLEKYAIPYKLNYDYIMEEFAVKTECFQALSNGSLDDHLRNQLSKLIPSLEDAKAMAASLNQGHTFQPLILHPIEYLLLRDSIDGATCSNNEGSKAGYIDDSSHCYSNGSKGEAHKPSTIVVKVQSAMDGIFSYWSIDKFYERLELMKDSYIQMLEDGDVPVKDIDAFHEDTDAEVPIGYSIISLKPIAYFVNIENPTVPVLDYITFQQTGTVNVSIHFCDECGGKINDTEIFIDNVDELLHENVTLKITLKDVQSIIHQFKEIYCEYQFLEEPDEVTKYLDGKASSFTGMAVKHEKRYSIEPVTENVLNLLLTQYVVLRFFGKQRSHKLLNLFGYQSAHSSRSMDGDFNSWNNPVEMENTMANLRIKEVVDQRRQHKLKALKNLVDQSELLGEGAIPVNIVKTLVEAKSKESADQSLKEHKELLTAPSTTTEEEAVQEKELPPELKALKRFSEICCIV